jgi:rifampin ADP-ribosylating transferase
MTKELKPFEVHESGALLHGTKADLAVGDLLVPGRPSTFEKGRTMNHVYVTETLDAAVWGLNWQQGPAAGGSTSWNRRAPWKTTRT